MMRTKDGHAIVPGMYVQDVNGLYKVLDVDDIRRVAEVQEVIVSDDDDIEPIGMSWYKTATDLKRCEVF